MKTKEFLTSKELAKRWRIAEGTLGKWRHLHKGPRYTKIEGVVLYPIEEIEKLESVVKPENEFYH